MKLNSCPKMLISIESFLSNRTSNLTTTWIIKHRFAFLKYARKASLPKYSCGALKYAELCKSSVYFISFVVGILMRRDDIVYMMLIFNLAYQQTEDSDDTDRLNLRVPQRLEFESLHLTHLKFERFAYAILSLSPLKSSLSGHSWFRCHIVVRLVAI